ncbi:MAG: hypothetical protein ETSY1_38315 [Candidatus Entotheonella factor]|uniref:LamG-like jellyroll fold domain-containing protein n=1 Tax=Entotheonella factor TaxID=1429438 RepID=W4L7I1_ENTF1|nr:MAG: hypothetical protein ETSY1_38315 [Candidatus Entotheonella factor]
MPTLSADQNLIKTYADRDYQHPVMVRHKGVVIAFAMDRQQQIYYTILDTGNDDNANGAHEGQHKNAGPLDVNYWLDNPVPLSFPNEIDRVGYGLVGAISMPIVENNKQETRRADIQADEIDLFLSTTARLTADAPFKVLSDNKYLYVFRQSIGADHQDMVFALKSGGVSGDSVRPITDFQLDAQQHKIPLVHQTMLVDRFVLVGTRLQPNMEVRFKRSRNKTRPYDNTDSLGAKDMDGKPFYGPTHQLDFVRDLHDGQFEVLLLPTEVADVHRWQIFTHNSATGRIDSFNIERSSDGLFTTKPTQFFTSPDPEYQSVVFERQPGICPFTGEPLIPLIDSTNYAESALHFDGHDDYVDFGNPAALQTTGSQTLEMWVKLASLGGRQNLYDKAYNGEGAITLEADGRLTYYYGAQGSPANNGTDAFDSILSTEALPLNTWTHIAIVRDVDAKQLHWYINGEPAGQATAKYAAAVSSTQSASIAKGNGRAGFFHGMMDEVRIWNRARNEKELNDTLAYRLAGNEDGLVAYWRFDENSGNSLYDQTDSACDGTVYSATWQFSDVALLDHPGVRHTSFQIASEPNGQSQTNNHGHSAAVDLQIVSSMSAVLYYQQEDVPVGYQQQHKPMKTHARVMLAVSAALSTRTVNPANPGYVTILDFSVSRQGKLAQVPDHIDIPRLVNQGQDGRNPSTILDEISTYQGQMTTLQQEIDAFDITLVNLKQEIQKLEQKIHDIPELERHLAALKNELRYCNQSWSVTFYEHPYYQGRSFTLHIGDKMPWIPHDIRSMHVERADFLHLQFYDMAYYQGRVREAELPYHAYDAQDIDFRVRVRHSRYFLWWETSRWYTSEHDATRSVRVLESQELRHQKQTLRDDIARINKDLLDLIDIRNNTLKPKYENFYHVQDQRKGKQLDLNTKRLKLAQLQDVYRGGVQPMPLQLLHVDPAGLTVAGGMLSFAQTHATPELFESAMGKLTLYYRGNNGEFYSAFYDTKTARVEQHLSVGSENLTFIARSAGIDMQRATITIADEGATPEAHPDHCRVTIDNPATGITEIWRAVPRDPKTFAAVLNSDVQPEFVGRFLHTEVTGAQITSLAVQELQRELTPGTTLRIGDTHVTTTKRVLPNTMTVPVTPLALNLLNARVGTLIYAFHGERRDLVGTLQASKRVSGVSVIGLGRALSPGDKLRLGRVDVTNRSVVPLHPVEIHIHGAVMGTVSTGTEVHLVNGDQDDFIGTWQQVTKRQTTSLLIQGLAQSLTNQMILEIGHVKVTTNQAVQPPANSDVPIQPTDLNHLQHAQGSQVNLSGSSIGTVEGMHLAIGHLAVRGVEKLNAGATLRVGQTQVRTRQAVTPQPAHLLVSPTAFVSPGTPVYLDEELGSVYDIEGQAIVHWPFTGNITGTALGRPKQPIGLAHFLDLRVRAQNPAILGIPM